MRPYRKVGLIWARRRLITMCIDSCCETREFPFVCICYIVLDTAKGVRRGGTAILTEEILSGFAQRTQYIALGEAFAPLLALWHERVLLTHASLVIFIDNLALLPALCKGSSTVALFGCIVHAIHLALASVGCRTWFEHVDSKANFADGGSRLGHNCPEAKSLGICLRQVPLPPWPKKPVAVGPEEWLSWFNGDL